MFTYAFVFHSKLSFLSTIIKGEIFLVIQKHDPFIHPVHLRFLYSRYLYCFSTHNSPKSEIQKYTMTVLTNLSYPFHRSVKTPKGYIT